MDRENDNILKELIQEDNFEKMQIETEVDKYFF